MKEEALKLADELQDYMTSLGWKTHQAPTMIRRLVEELDVALDYIKQFQLEVETLDKQIIKYKFSWNMAENELEKLKKPLSDDETIQLACDTFYGLIKKEERDNFIRFARAIEERHGIK